MEVMRFNSYIGKQTRIDEAARTNALVSLIVLLALTSLICSCSTGTDARETKITAGIVSGIAVAVALWIAFYTAKGCYWNGDVDWINILEFLIAVFACIAFIALLYSGAFVASVIGAVAAVFFVFVLSCIMEEDFKSPTKTQWMIMLMLLLATGLISFGILYYLPKLIGGK